jgi:hypothetical protein
MWQVYTRPTSASDFLHCKPLFGEFKYVKLFSIAAKEGYRAFFPLLMKSSDDLSPMKQSMLSILVVKIYLLYTSKPQLFVICNC